MATVVKKTTAKPKVVAKKPVQTPAQKAAAVAKARVDARRQESDAKDIKAPVMNALPPGVSPAVAQAQLRNAQMAREADIRSKPTAARPDLTGDYSSMTGQMTTGPVTATKVSTPVAPPVVGQAANTFRPTAEAQAAEAAKAARAKSQGSGTRQDPFRGETLNNMRGLLFGIPTKSAQTMGGNTGGASFLFPGMKTMGTNNSRSTPNERQRPTVNFANFGKPQPGGGMFSSVYNGGFKGGKTGFGFEKGGAVPTPTKAATSSGSIKDPFGYGKK